MGKETLNTESTREFSAQQLPSFFQLGDTAKITFLKDDVVATVTKVHFAGHPKAVKECKVLYDFELIYHDPIIEDRTIRTRIHNIDSALTYAPPSENE